MSHFRVKIEATVTIETENEGSAIEQVNEGSWDSVLDVEIIEIAEFEEPPDLGPSEFAQQEPPA